MSYPEPVGLECSTTEDVFSSLVWDHHDTWSDADLASALVYLRGSKSLQLDTWRKHFPNTIPP